MIKYLRSTQIDKNRWDNCISRSVNRRIYAFSWYLDLVCPGWDALVTEDYSSVFPLTHHRKWMINYLAQPFFAQQLGIFSIGKITEPLVTEFIRAIPGKFRFVEIHLNSVNTYASTEGKTTLRVNYELDMTPVYAQLTGNYAQNTRRNIRKAHESEITCNRATGTSELIGLFRENFGKKEGKLNDTHYLVLQRLIDHCLMNNLGYILGSKTKTGTLSAGAFFLFDQERVYFLFAASSAEARENGAMFLLIDEFIAENAGKNFLLDFEGGNDPNLGRFYKSFGAFAVSYQALQLNRLSKTAERGLYFIRKFRK